MLATALRATPGARSRSSMSNASFGELTPLIAPRAVAVIGASDREGNLGGLAVGYLAKFGYAGAVWPVNPAGGSVRGAACFRTLRDVPGVPDLAIVAVAAPAVTGVIQECADLGVPAAVVWAGGFSEAGDEGATRQRALAALCRERGIKLCGPNCIGVINTSIGLTASFSSMLNEKPTLTAGAVSMVSQSGGIGVMAHARAQDHGLGFRVMVSCGNEATLTVADFMYALVHDDGTKVLAVYVEALGDAAAFVRALEAARNRGKPVVVMKGGASEASGRAALAHTGRLAGSDRVFDAVLREFAAIRVHSTEELLDVSLQLASLREDQLPAGDRVLVSSFGGGSGVVCVDQCVREGLVVPTLGASMRAAAAPLLTPLGSVANPVDFTPGMITDPANRARMPDALCVLSSAPDVDAWIFLAAGFAKHAREVAEMFDVAQRRSSRPMLLSWQAMPAGTPEFLASRGIHVFTESARAARTMGHLARYASRLRQRAEREARSRAGNGASSDDLSSAEAQPHSEGLPPLHAQAVHRSEGPPLPPAGEGWGEGMQEHVALDWNAHIPPGIGHRVITEDRVAAILTAAHLPVSAGHRANSETEALAFATEVDFPVAMKALSPAITHRAAAGLVALDLRTADDVVRTWRTFTARAAELQIELDGVWVQHMAAGNRELLVTALRDAQFGVIVGCGIGGGMTEVVDDVAFARAPVGSGDALDLLAELRTLRQHPGFLTAAQRRLAADFIARFSTLAADAPWDHFTLEVNPLKLDDATVAAVDGLLILD